MSLGTTTFYKHVVVDIPHPYMKYVVGKKGVYLKKCCTNSGVNSVWFNMKRSVVEIYGPVSNLEKASKFVENRIDKVRSKIPQIELEEYKKTFVENSDSHICGSLDGALTKEQVKYLIGKKGKNFKKFTKDAGVSFIWYDEPNHNIVIWGPQEKLGNAVQMLFQEIDKIKNYDSSSKIIEDSEMSD